MKLKPCHIIRLLFALQAFWLSLVSSPSFAGNHFREQFKKASAHHFATSMLCGPALASLSNHSDHPFDHAFRRLIIEPAFRDAEKAQNFHFTSRGLHFYAAEIDQPALEAISRWSRAIPLRPILQLGLQPLEDKFADTIISRSQLEAISDELIAKYDESLSVVYRILTIKEETQPSWSTRFQIISFRIYMAWNFALILHALYRVVPSQHPNEHAIHFAYHSAIWFCASTFAAFTALGRYIYSLGEYETTAELTCHSEVMTRFLAEIARPPKTGSRYVAILIPMYAEPRAPAQDQSTRMLTADDELEATLATEFDSKNLRYLVMESLQSSDSDEVFVRGSIRHQPLICEAPWK